MRYKLKVRYKNKKINSKELAGFCRQLSFMLSSGITLIESLEIIIEYKISNQVDIFAKRLTTYLEEGFSLGEACDFEKEKIPVIMINLITAGEVGGFLDLSFEQLADYFDKEIKIKSTIKTALTYPFIVCLVSLLALGIVFTVIMPIFADILDDIEVTLPLLTTLILTTSFYVRKYWILFSLLLLACLLSIYLCFKTPKGKFFLDRLILKIPIIREFNQKVITARFSYVFSKLLNSGIVILEILEIVEKTVENTLLKKEVFVAQEKIKNGMSFSESLKASVCLHPIALQMIAIGENSGTLDILMQKVGEKFEQEIEISSERLPKLIEPFFIVILGFIVGSIILGVLIPMFTVINQIGNF